MVTVNINFTRPIGYWSKLLLTKSKHFTYRKNVVLMFKLFLIPLRFMECLNLIAGFKAFYDISFVSFSL